MNHFPFHIGDYMTATHHLTMAENGTYLRLLTVYYAKECALPPDIGAIVRLAGGRGKRDRRLVESILHEFFIPSELGWHHQRCDEELAKYKGLSKETQSQVTNRQQRYREEQRELVAQAREMGLEVAYNTPLTDLRSLIAHAALPLTASPDTSPDTSPVTSHVTHQLPVNQDQNQYHYPIPNAEQQLTSDATQVSLPETNTVPVSQAATDVTQASQSATSTTQAQPVAPLSGTRIGLLCQKLRSQIAASPAAFAKPGWNEVLAAFDDEFILEIVRAKRLGNPHESYGINYFLPGLLDAVRKQREGSAPVDPRGRPDPFNLNKIDRSADAARMEACLKKFNIVITDDTPLDF
jgi:uncharacterized protein YdaU (DUF1376 family)